MDKQTYLEKKTALEAELEKLTEEYILANAEFKTGDTLVLTDYYNPNGLLVSVVGVYTDYNDCIKYSLKKLKKDGSVSSVKANYYNEYKLEEV